MDKYEKKRLKDLMGPGPREAIDQKKLMERVEDLKQLGVIFPNKYPPANLETHPEVLFGFLGEIEVAELLVKQFPPNTIEILENESIQGKDGTPYIGDIDIVIHNDPPIYLQVKNKILTSFDDNNPLQVDSINGGALKVIENQIQKDGLLDKPTLATAKIYLDPDGNISMDYSLKELVLQMDVTEIIPVHVNIIEFDDSVTKENDLKKIEGSIKGASSQLVKYNDGIIVPVINLTRFPHDQASIYTHIRDSLKDPTHPKKIGGVLLITNTYKQESSNEKQKNRRIIPISNPNAEDGKRLNEADFNNNLPDEDIYFEPPVFIIYGVWENTKPYDVKIENNCIMINGVKYCELPEGLSILALKQTLIPIKNE